MDSVYATAASDDEIAKTAEALKVNGFEAQVVENKEAAKEAVLKLIPKGSEVLTVTSVTLDKSGINEVVNGSGYVSVRHKMMELMGNPEKLKDTRRITVAPDYVVGSAHALTQDGKIMIASATGSQMPSESYGADHVILVIGAQKIVRDLQEGLKRINDYVVPLEDERALKAYGAHTSFNKLLILNKEKPGRITVIVIREEIGF